MPFSFSDQNGLKESQKFDTVDTHCNPNLSQLIHNGLRTLTPDQYKRGISSGWKNASYTVNSNDLRDENFLFVHSYKWHRTPNGSLASLLNQNSSAGDSFKLEENALQAFSIQPGKFALPEVLEFTDFAERASIPILHGQWNNCTRLKSQIFRKRDILEADGAELTCSKLCNIAHSFGLF